MPDISAIGQGLLGMTAQAGQGNLDQTAGAFRGVMQSALGEEAAGQLDAALHAQDRITREAVPTTSFGPATGDVAALGGSLSRAVANRLEQVTASDAKAAADKQTLLTGGDIELHNVILSAERAQLELQLTMQLRNKLLEAYQEIMRMPI